MPVNRPDWLPEERFPFAVRELTLPGGDITYLDEGDGPVLLFVHAGMWSFIFRDVITRLATDFRCVTLDFPGFGLASTDGLAGAGSGSMPAPTLVDLSALVGQFVDALDLDDITLVVHDLGGPVAVGAFAEPHRAGRLRGIVPANTFLWRPDKRSLRTMLRVVGSWPMTTLGTATNLVPRLTSGRGGVGRHLDDADRAVFLGPYRQRAPRRRFHQAMGAALRSDELFERVERAVAGPLASLPALTIYGERNDPFGFQDRMAERFADHEPHVFAEGNHFPMMDDPGLFSQLVRDWHRRRVAPRIGGGDSAARSGQVGRADRAQSG